MSFDQFEIRIDPAKYIPWTGGGGFQPVEIRINGIGLIELVRGVEEPFVEAEVQQRVASGEDINEIGFSPGRYFYLPPSLVIPPSRNLLNEPWDHGFVLAPEDKRFGKSTVLGCTCGVIECWFIVVRIKLDINTVEWSDFSQFHRNWPYNLGPFTFRRAKYEEELAKYCT